MYCTTEWLNGFDCIPCHTSNYAQLGGRDVDTIVVHYTGNSKDTARANGRYFQNSGIGASAHFFIDDNEVIQSVPLNSRAWHAGSKSVNQVGIGLEMCTSGNYIVSEATKKRTIRLIVQLMSIYGISKVIRHYDVTGKECPAQMAGKDNAEWNKFLVDIKNAYDEYSKPVADNTLGGEIMYKTVNDVPDWAKNCVIELVNKGVIADGNKLNLSEEGLRIVVFLYRAVYATNKAE